MRVSPQVGAVLGGTESPAPPLVRSGWLNEPFGPRACSCGYRLDCLLAGPFTAATGFCADAAMLMLAGMALAFFRADAAGLGARFEGGDDHLLVGSRPACRDRARGHADIGAVEIEANALPELVHHLLGDTSVGI